MTGRRNFFKYGGLGVVLALPIETESKGGAYAGVWTR